MDENGMINIKSEDVENVFNIDDEDSFDVEDITRIKNITYGNEVLHPTGNSYEVDMKKQQMFPVEIRYASVFFEPNVGQNGEDPPFSLAYGAVKREVDKLVFKYELSDWINWYAIRVDAPENNSHYNGSPCVLTQIPYATYDIDKAKELIINYTIELMSLIGQEEVMLYFDAKTGFMIRCKYDLGENQVRPLNATFTGKLVSTEIREFKDVFTISVTLEETTMKEAARALYEAIVNRTSYDTIQVPFYIHAKEANASVCFAAAITYQNHGEYYPQAAETIFRRAVEEELEEAKLNFNNITVI